jgi:hypothetical protein
MRNRPGEITLVYARALTLEALGTRELLGPRLRRRHLPTATAADTSTCAASCSGVTGRLNR